MIGEALRVLRVFNGYKAKELAEALKISPSFISEIENGGKKPTLDLLNRYGEVFHVKVSTLILFSEALEEDGPNDIRHNIAGAGMKFLKILEKYGDLQDG